MAHKRAIRVTGQPYSKESQLARGPKRYRRKVASPKQWQAIISAKDGPCRMCGEPGNFLNRGGIQYHHLIPRDQHGDDVADNIVPLHVVCHTMVEYRQAACVRRLLGNLRDAEYAYAVGKAGENWAERIYGIEYQR